MRFTDPPVDESSNKDEEDDDDGFTNEEREAYFYTVSTSCAGGRKVRLPIHEVHVVSHELSLFNDLTPTQKKDVECFEKDCALTALMYVKRKEVGVPWDEGGKDYTLRGLESLIRNVNKDCSERDEHVLRVLKEQERLHDQQRKKKSDDLSQRLRSASCQSSKADRIRAMNRAREDATVAGHAPKRYLMKSILKKLK